MITTEQILKFKDRIVPLFEGRTTVKAHTSRSKKGKVFQVRQFERDVKDLIGKRVTVKNDWASGTSDAYGANVSGIFKGVDYSTGVAKAKILQKKAHRTMLVDLNQVPALRRIMKSGKKPISAEARAERNRKARERHWTKTGVGSGTINWMKQNNFL